MNSMQLECFIRVGTTLNFVKAAEELHISQPALSKQVKSLENELGVVLLERTTRSVRLTASGERFIADAQKILQQMEDSKRRITKFNSEQIDHLRIGYSDAHELQRITPVIVQLRKKHDRLVPDYHIDMRDVNLQLLRENRLDVIFALKDDAKLGSNMAFQPLFTENLHCLVSMEHPLAKEQSLLSEDVRKYPQILCVPYTPIIAARTNRFIRSVPLNDEDNLTICTSAAEAYSLAISGVGAAILPKHLIVPFPNIRLIPITDSNTHVYGMYYIKLNNSQLLKDFVTLSSRVFGEHTEVEDIWPTEFRNNIQHV